MNLAPTAADRIDIQICRPRLPAISIVYQIKPATTPAARLHRNGQGASTTVSTKPRTHQTQRTAAVARFDLVHVSLIVISAG